MSNNISQSGSGSKQAAIGNNNNQNIKETSNKTEEYQSKYHLEKPNIGALVDTANAPIHHVYAQSTYSSEEKKTLAEAAQEIQELLEQLSQSYPTSTNLEVVNEAIKQIESQPSFKARVISALKAGGIEVFKEAVDHPLVNIFMTAIEGWQEPKQ